MSWFHLRKQKNFSVKAEWERPELHFLNGVVHHLNKNDSFFTDKGDNSYLVVGRPRKIM